jgi:transketolase
MQINESMSLIEDLFGESIEKVSTRKGFGVGLVEAGEQDGRVVALSADLVESVQMEGFKQRFPERFMEVGVAEQNLVTVAAGMAATDKIPFTGSYAAFQPGRCWEQIRTTICYNNVPVKIVGSHAGITVGPDGATHQMLEDIALMRVLPNMVVLSPCDIEEARKATVAAAKIDKPVYIRLCRANTPVFTTTSTPFEIGKANVLCWGEKVTIIATGPLVYEALKAAKEIDGEVINVHTIKPLDRETILGSVQKTGKVITIEDHQVAGGLGSAVAELLSQELPTKMKIIGVEDRFGESGEASELLEKYGLTAKRIIEEGRKLVVN